MHSFSVKTDKKIDCGSHFEKIRACNYEVVPFWNHELRSKILIMNCELSSF